jgi:hypothetical protein
VTSNPRGRRATRTSRVIVKRFLLGCLSILGVALVGAIVSVALGWTGIGDWRPFCKDSGSCAEGPQGSDNRSSEAGVQPSSNPTSSSASTPSPTVSPEPVSAQPIKHLDRGTLTLSEGSSSVVGDWELRISTGSIFDTFARVSSSTETNRCEALLDVGDSIVLSNRSSGSTDYSQWYAVVLTSTTNGQATIEWSVGSGAAPATDPSSSCV